MAQSAPQALRMSYRGAWRALSSAAAAARKQVGHTQSSVSGVAIGIL
ncbi:MAG: hypothetical protein JO245_12280 [Pseudolabrys sp.]|nr:hypothetical protein [Pseudolabrys sp.]